MPLDVTVRIIPPLDDPHRPRAPLRPRRDLNTLEPERSVDPARSGRIQQALQRGVLRVRDTLQGKGVSEGALEVQLHAIKDGADVHITLETGDRRYVTDGGDTALPDAIRDGFSELIARIDQDPPLGTPSTNGVITWTLLRNTARRHALHGLERHVDAGELVAGRINAEDLADRALERIIAERYPNVAIDDELPGADSAGTLRVLLAAVDGALDAEVARIKDDPEPVAAVERDRPDTAADAAAAEERRRLTRALFDLDEDDRHLFSQAVIDGLPFHLVAAVHDLDEDTVEDRLVDILEALGAHLDVPGATLLDRYARLGRTLRGEVQAQR